MERRLVGGTMVAAPVALAAAAIAVGMSTTSPAWWAAAVHLAILGGITLMIYAVNIRIVPVFARRPWPSARLLVAQVVAGGAGAWLTFLGKGLREDALVRTGQALALAGGLLFMSNVVRLFKREPAFRHTPPAADPAQPAVDRIATKFTRLSGMLLVLGLALGAALSWWRPGTGRWDLVWAHALLVGFFLTMASGVCYHVLGRWTGRSWRSVRAVRLHYELVLLSLPFMLLALATDAEKLFLVAGPAQAAAIALFLVNILPLVWRLDGPVRAGILVAIAFLVAGVGLGVAFAIDPGLGPRLRQTHATANVFGFGGLLISGFGYVFVTHFAGRSLRWPRLARAQVGVLLLGVAGGVLATLWRALDGGPDVAVILAQGVVAAGMLLFAAQVAGTFAGRPPDAVVVLRPVPATPRGA
jgi:hypothetical protein